MLDALESGAGVVRKLGEGADADVAESAAKRPKTSHESGGGGIGGFLSHAWDDVKSGASAANDAVHAAGHGLDKAAQSSIGAVTDGVRAVAGNDAANAFHGAAEAVRGGVKQGAGFAYGVGEGAVEAGGGMVESTAKLAGDGVKFATDGTYRKQVLNSAGHLASEVAHDPLGTAGRVGSGIVHGGEDWLRGAGKAAQEGDLGEYLGKGAGNLAVNVGGMFVPGADAADAANLAAHGAEGAEALSSAGRVLGGAERGVEGASGAERGVDAAAGVEHAADEAGGGAGAAAAAPKVEHFSSLEDFNRAANHAAPNTDYRYGTYSWKTDAKGRVSSVEGQVELGKNGRIATDGVGTTTIGKSADAKPGDVGFHLIGDQFEGPINRLNVVPGNGVSVGDLKSLNLSGYKKWENEVASLAREPGNTVNVRIEAQYRGSNATTRPDAFYASHQVNGGDWVTTVFRNRAGG